MVEKVASELRKMRLSKVAEETGIHENTLRKIMCGKTANPSWRVMSTLSEYLRIDLCQMQ